MTTKAPMTREQRIAEFHRLYATIPGKNTEKIQVVRDILCCKEITVRIYCMAKPTRACPEYKLNVLRDGLQKRAEQAQAGANE